MNIPVDVGLDVVKILDGVESKIGATANFRDLRVTNILLDAILKILACMLRLQLYAVKRKVE